MTAAAGRAGALAAVDAVLAQHPEVTALRAGEGAWLMSIPGEVRQRIPVAVTVGDQLCELRCFLLRGPRAGRGDPSALHRLLLRRNAGSRWARLVLDDDDDVLIIVRLPTGGLTEAVLEEALAEIYLLSEASFEPLVHTAYPGVFAPLHRPGQGGPTATGEVARPGPDGGDGRPRAAPEGPPLHS